MQWYLKMPKYHSWHFHNRTFYRLKQRSPVEYFWEVYQWPFGKRFIGVLVTTKPFLVWPDEPTQLSRIPSTPALKGIERFWYIYMLVWFQQFCQFIYFLCWYRKHLRVTKEQADRLRTKSLSNAANTSSLVHRVHPYPEVDDLIKIWTTFGWMAKLLISKNCAGASSMLSLCNPLHWKSRYQLQKLTKTFETQTGLGVDLSCLVAWSSNGIGKEQRLIRSRFDGGVFVEDFHSGGIDQSSFFKPLKAWSLR